MKGAQAHYKIHWTANITEIPTEQYQFAVLGGGSMFVHGLLLRDAVQKVPTMVFGSGMHPNLAALARISLTRETILISRANMIQRRASTTILGRRERGYSERNVHPFHHNEERQRNNKSDGTSTLWRGQREHHAIVWPSSSPSLS